MILAKPFSSQCIFFLLIAFAEPRCALSLSHTLTHTHTHIHAFTHPRTNEIFSTLAPTPLQPHNTNTQIHTSCYHTHTHLHTSCVCVFAFSIQAWISSVHQGTKPRIIPRTLTEFLFLNKERRCHKHD